MARKSRRSPRKKAGSSSNEGLFIVLFILLVLGAWFGSSLGQIDMRATAWNLLTGLAFAGVVVGALMLAWWRFKYGHIWSIEKEEYAETFARDRLFEIHPEKFEHLVATYFKKKGFIAKPTRYSKDHGIDVELWKAGIKYKAQAKRYKKGRNVSEEEVRTFCGSITDYPKRGFFVTTSDFTLDAQKWALQHERQVKLINGNRLIETFEEEELEPFVPEHIRIDY